MKGIKKIHNQLSGYVYDSSIDIEERTFIMLSVTVLVALFAAIPCGLIMHEPISATISTIIGAIFFTIYVIYVYKKNKIERAKVVLSVILVFVFLPAMFFSNGGVEGGTPIWLLLGTIYIALILEGKLKIIMIICEAVVMIICWIVGYLFPNLIIGYSRGGNYFDSIAALFIVSGIIYTLINFQSKLYVKEEEQKNVQRLFSQTAMALANAIDAKDKYTHGHSSRVAEYSKKIAERAGKSPSECEEIYYVALLHDVGKIGVPEAIISKEGKLTKEEFDLIKQHPVMGAQILKSITEYPYLSIGANFHHERYDGKGYPQKLKGSDIPEVARIISVADAYDAMTSKRSYRDTITQDKVREQLIEGAGTQFDPEFANIMLHLIDMDTEYEMKEREEIKELAGKNVLVIGEHRDDISEGIWINPYMTTIEMKVSPNKTIASHSPKPSLVIFDSLDGRYHDEEKEIKELLYFEYCEIWFDGRATNKGIRKIETKKRDEKTSLARGEYRIEAVKVKDHALIKIYDREGVTEFIIALPDSSRYVYIGLSGEQCRISDVKIEKSEEKTDADFIPRIIEEISFINVPAGDIPNVQVDGYRSESTRGIPIKDGMKISFHSVSLPTARLVWHCPSYVIFSSDDGTVNGENYKEFSLVRLDGENWEAEHVAENELLVNRQDFNGWDSWKNYNRNGFDCSVSFKRDGNTIVSQTENDGISIKDTTHVLVDTEEIYVALSGDQCALTNIRINYAE